MKISAWHKEQGDQVFFRQPAYNPDIVYIACVFSWNRPKALGVARMFNCEVRIGGIGFNSKLPDEIEHIMPDYDLYGVDYSMGYTSRGCIRNCPWCVVPKSEGRIRDHAPISEFWNPRHKKLILLDNNFLASPKWKENLEFIIANRLEVSICQGLDIRLINDETARWLAILRAKTPSFSGRDMIYFAFDDVKHEEEVRRGVEILKAHGIPPRRLTFYFLCGFKSPLFTEEDMHRFQVLRELEVNPFAMIYRDPNETRFRFDPLLKHFANWVNKPERYKSCKFSEFIERRGSKEEKERLRAMKIE
jgi:hypothetical protein